MYQMLLIYCTSTVRTPASLHLSSLPIPAANHAAFLRLARKRERAREQKRKQKPQIVFKKPSLSICEYNHCALYVISEKKKVIQKNVSSTGI